MARIRKPTRPAHFSNGQKRPRLTFDAAYKLIKENTRQRYFTTGNRSPFKATAQHGVRGRHREQKVIVFRAPKGKERARAYRCCWGHRTNCNRTYIDCYVGAI